MLIITSTICLIWYNCINMNFIPKNLKLFVFLNETKYSWYTIVIVIENLESEDFLRVLKLFTISKMQSYAWQIEIMLLNESSILTKFYNVMVLFPFHRKWFLKGIFIFDFSYIVSQSFAKASNTLKRFKMRDGSEFCRFWLKKICHHQIFYANIQVMITFQILKLFKCINLIFLKNIDTK